MLGDIVLFLLDNVVDDVVETVFVDSLSGRDVVVVEGGGDETFGATIVSTEGTTSTADDVPVVGDEDVTAMA